MADVAVVAHVVEVLDDSGPCPGEELPDQLRVDLVVQHPLVGGTVDLLARLDQAQQPVAELMTARLAAALLAAAAEQARRRLAVDHLQSLPDALDAVAGRA